MFFCLLLVFHGLCICHLTGLRIPLPLLLEIRDTSPLLLGETVHKRLPFLTLRVLHLIPERVFGCLLCLRIRQLLPPCARLS